MRVNMSLVAVLNNIKLQVPYWAAVCIITLLLTITKCEIQQDKGISKQILENWASKFGGPLFEFGRSITKYNELQGRFQNSVDSEVKKIELDKLIVEVTNEMNTVLKEKIESIRKIMLWAEEKALEYYEVPPDSRPSPEQTYYNAKKLNRESGKPDPKELYHQIDLQHDHHFGTSVNTSFSSIHVPTSIYELKEDLLESIGWTSNMDSTFISNYQTNPTLSWQYFGSATGFLRQYPAMKWPNENHDRQNPDLYDCRTRPWYVTAANSPKNLIILQDISGSMTGLRREIAKHVVSTILDTLTENDFVNVYNFSDEATPVVPCFKNMLVQANLENVRELKGGLDQDHTAGVANFSAALHTAFDILEKQFNDNQSSHCNQGIMIITDGAPYPFEDIFKARQNPMHMARVFTYLIGRDVTDKREVMYMACANNGYYTHVSTLSEVQEQVLKYIPVMARPMVMHQHHEVTWTPVYADIAVSPARRRKTYWLLTYRNKDAYETDWSWQDHNSRRQYKRSGKYKEYLRLRLNQNVSFVDFVDPETEIEKIMEFLDDDYDENGNFVKKPKPLDSEQPIALAISAKKLKGRLNKLHANITAKAAAELWKSRKDFRFVVTASIPVFDLRNASAGDRIAILLGVAGTDITVKELQKIASPFKLGVNGYSYMINNNGYVVFHPDWRPVFRQELLKPNYNTVDFSEVELIDNDATLKNNDSVLLEMRQEMIELDRGYRNLKVRVHQDDFRRVAIRKQKYEYSKVKLTPYTLGLSVPANLHRFTGEMELRRDLHQGMDVSSFFGQPNEPRRWTINPDWTYCEYVRGGPTLDVKEDLLLHFLKKIQKTKQSWAWRNTGVGIKPRHSSKDKFLDGDIYSCEKELVQSLVFDANVTEVFTEKKLWKINKEDKQMIELNGAEMAFIATRSGLTRWIDFQNQSNSDFVKQNNKATGELWYKRAVERYEMDPDSFVFSVPFDAGQRNDTRVTATRAVFVRKNNLEAPVAVVGIQLNHSKWSTRFFEITSSCIETKGSASNYVDGSCKKTCTSGEYDCFVLDDNGFILISERPEDTGRFFGEVDGTVMEMLVNSDVYRRVRVVDYQGVCFQPVSKSNFGNFLRTPLDHLHNVFAWMLGHLAWVILQLNIHSFINPDYTSVLADMASNNDYMHLIDEGTSDTLHPFLELASINKTRLRPCDKESFLYTYGSSYNTYNFSYHGLLTKCGHSRCDGYFNVHFIPHTNLILVVTDGKCRCGLNSTNVKSKEVNYFPEDANIEDEEDEQAQLCRSPRVNLFRQRPDSCVNYNANERDIKEDCGRGTLLKGPLLLLIALNILTGARWI